MRSKLLLILVLFGSSVFAQSAFLGKWYLVTKNNYRSFEIKADSLLLHVTDGFTKETTCGLTELDYHYTIQSKVIHGDSMTCIAIKEKSDTATFVFYLDSTKKETRLLVKERKKGEEGPFFTLVNEAELNTYPAFKSLDKMSEADFITFAQNLKKIMAEPNISSYGRHYITSRMKYLLIDLGYDPRFAYKQLPEILKSFEQNERTKGLYDAVFNRKR
ncbi:MAG: hypothetical protein EP332_06740 [Bacteroidetes bacterium]|nr:MAG: hypothetical protein EP332_06740 [Bacteroidota bacterium]